MAHPPPPRPAVPVLSEEERLVVLEKQYKAAASTIEAHIDAWLKGQGTHLAEKPEVPIGEHGSIEPAVMALIVDSYRAAGWASATIGGESPGGDKLDPRGIVLYLDR